MTLNTIKYAMPSGIPGAISRTGGGVPMDVEAVIMDPVNYLGAYGLFGFIDAVNGDFRKLAAGDATVYGLLVRPYPSNAQTTTGFFGSTALGTAAVPPQSGSVAALRQGYMTVKLQANNAGVVTNPVKGAVVYACIQNPPAGGFAGGVLGAADGGNTIATKWIFNGPPDADGNIEISNIGNNA